MPTKDTANLVEGGEAKGVPIGPTREERQQKETAERNEQRDPRHRSDSKRRNRCNESKSKHDGRAPETQVNKAKKRRSEQFDRRPSSVVGLRKCNKGKDTHAGTVRLKYIFFHFGRYAYHKIDSYLLKSKILASWDKNECSYL